MKVILLESMSNLGSIGEVVKVRPGYARNYLLPKGKVLPATDRNVGALKHQKLLADHKVRKAREASEEFKTKLEKEGITIRRKVGKNEKLFGSVTPMDIEEALRGKGFILNRRQLGIEEPIKKTGKFEIPLKLDGGLQAILHLEVVGEPQE